MKTATLVAALLLSALLVACTSDEDDKGAANGNGTVATAPTGSENYGGAPAGGVQTSTLDQETQELKQQVGDTIHFAFDSSDISSEAQAILQRQAAYMQKYPNLTFTIEGHCDERGTREYNLALGERRASATKQALIALGVDGQRLRTISYGKERPIAVGSNEAAWAMNRRAVTVIN